MGSIADAVAKHLIAPLAARQGALSLLRDTSRQSRLAEQVVRGPKGELYMFPGGASLAERAAWDPMRELVNDTFSLRKGVMPDRKTADSARLADTIVQGAMPRNRAMPVTMDALAASLNDPGTRMQAASTWGATNNPGKAFLYDLVGDPKTPGAGYEHLRDVLSGPLMPDADQVLFTPLPGVRDFYKKRFGADYIHPNDIASDPDLDRLLRGLGQHFNADDLGVGVIKRAQGGLVRCHCGR